MANFQDILNKPIDDIKAPSALPTGTYLCLIDGQPEHGPVGKKETPAAIFNFKPMQAMTDVDPQLLQTALDGSSLADKKIRFTFVADRRRRPPGEDVFNRAPRYPEGPRWERCSSWLWDVRCSSVSDIALMAIRHRYTWMSRPPQKA